MTQKRKSKKKSGAKDGFVGRLFAQTKLPAHVTEEQDWYLDTPDVRLTRVFTIVLILHVVAVGGILAFKMVEKASTPATVAVSPEEGTKSAPAAPAPDAGKSAQVQPKTATPATPAKPAPSAQAKNQAGLVMEHPSAPGYRQYRVAAGDNLVGIAREMNVSAAGLRELNQLSEDTRLMPGKWLMIPGPGKSTAPAKSSPPKPEIGKQVAKVESKPPASGSGVRPLEKPKTPASKTPDSAAKGALAYEVQKGDTFFGIAREFGLNYKELMDANGIESPEGLQAGMTLKIPKN